MRFLILGDLHGKEPKIFYSDFDAIISPGDFCSDNLRKYMFKSLKENTKNSTNVPWYKSIGEKKAKELIKESISDGRKVLKKLNSFNVPVYIVPGNWDQSYGKSKIKDNDMDKSPYNYLKAFYDWWLGDRINPKLTKVTTNDIKKDIKIKVEYLDPNEPSVFLTGACTPLPI